MFYYARRVVVVVVVVLKTPKKITSLFVLCPCAVSLQLLLVAKEARALSDNVKLTWAAMSC